MSPPTQVSGFVCRPRLGELPPSHQRFKMNFPPKAGFLDLPGSLRGEEQHGENVAHVNPADALKQSRTNEPDYLELN